MSRMQRFEWLKRRSGIRSQSYARHDRRLWLEPLEDRRMLASFTVTNVNDSGFGSLRDAVISANNAVGHDTVLFNASLSGQTITLGGTDIDVTESITIDATALDENVIIDADDQSRIFDIGDNLGTSTLAGLTLINGRVTGNQTPGGAVSSGVSPLIIDRSIISDSNTDGNQSYGGGIFVNSGLTISNSTVSGNSASRGGGISAYGDVTVTNSTINGNRAGYGGGIFSFNEVVLTRSTVSDNIGTKGGGIFAFGAITLNQSTVFGNSTLGANGQDGGGIWNDNDSVVIQGSIVTGNTDDGDNPDLYLGSGSVSVSYSLIGDTTGTSVTAGSSNVVNQPALLGPLADNGGFTQTHSLMAGSPALDAGNPAIVFNPAAFDQRGDPFIRVSDGDLVPGARIDMGALEVQPIPAAFFVVDTLVDELDGSVVDGDTSLRDAIAAASEGQVITFSVTGVINLTLGQLDIDKGLTITGPGSSLLTIDASGGNSRIFDIMPNPGNDSVLISGLTLTGGNVTGSGGAILSREDFTLSNSVVTGNTATDNGGGIDAVSSSNISGPFMTTIIDSVVSDNGTTSSGGKGGGIFVSTVVGSSTTITGSTISGNTTAGSNGEGGGLYSINSGTLTISATTVFGNSTYGFSSGGGGMYLETTSGGTTTISESTIANNSAGKTAFDSGRGGGLAVSNAGTTNIISSTISGNLGRGDGGGVSVFGGSGDTNIAHSTITLNTSDPTLLGGIRGGGIAQSDSGTVTLDHTIVAGNSDDNGTGPDIAGSVAASFSFVGDAKGATVTDNGGNQIGSSGGDLSVSIDMAAMGDFEDASDSYNFEYSLNGAGFLPLFTSSADEGNSLSYTLEDGSMELLSDPLQVNGTTLDNLFQTLSAVIPGSVAGDSLELRFTATSDSNEEAFAFRNISVQWATGASVVGRALDSAPDLNVTFVQDDPDYAIASDMFGIRSRINPGTPDLPPAIVDNSVPSSDSLGIIQSTDMADFFGVVDTVNSTGNDINVARWTFNIVDQTIDPLLGPLLDNGGPTETHALLVGSPAINVGDDTAVAGSGGVPLYDQRGAPFDRIVSNIDIGAFELQTAPSADFDVNGTVDGFDFLAWQRGFGTLSPNANKADGDADDDLDVDRDDLVVWQSQYGIAESIVAAASAPLAAEPLLTSGELADLALAVELAEDTSTEQELILEDQPLVATAAIENAISNESIVTQPLVPTIAESSEASLEEDDEANGSWLTDELLEQVFG